MTSRMQVSTVCITKNSMNNLAFVCLHSDYQISMLLSC